MISETNSSPTSLGTNINGFMYAAYAVLNVGGMKNRKRGTILNVTSVTGLEGKMEEFPPR